MNHFFENNTYHLISSIIWGVQFFSHLLTACINPGIPSRKNFLPEYIKENKIRHIKDIYNSENLLVNFSENMSHFDTKIKFFV